MTRIAAALLGADPLYLATAITAVEHSTAAYLHLDIMDGHYTPDISFGLRTVRAIAASTQLALDIHLQTLPAQRYIEGLADLGAARIAFHTDTVDDIDDALDMLTGTGTAVGLVLNPDQPLELLDAYLTRLDYIVLMTSRPGTSTFEPVVLDKIRALRELVDQRGHTGIELVADGGITSHTAPEVTAAGADILVAASALFQTPDHDIPAAVTHLTTASGTRPARH
ncbi:ribulose-phosphate 3-epimerase [Nocardia sp. alder85J]|uniref:ribulose-phosphate 3-epimerase n=1 Tax=Nocardia sp. alder85J TaxID=2862949 RepID=UPI001CD24EE0|nr:ribulose-phosphate 3-epimerase [Nocardia sp. alder85J]MCX4097932.1 ribulose-phosphate 3-epimerase [Nocardia sp. alder85J]